MIGLSEKTVGVNAGRSRGLNRQVVLGRIRSGQRVGRAEIARATGLSTQAVSNIIADLLADGLIIEKGHRAATRGVPVAQYSLNPEGAFAVGVEIRPDRVSASLLNLTGEPVARKRRKFITKCREDVGKSVTQMTDAVVTSSGLDPDRLLGVGIVMPGPFVGTGLRGGAAELPIWDDIPPQKWLSEQIDIPFLIENDANAAAIAERISGVAQEIGDYVCLYFGRGLGMGIVHQGRLMAGGFGNAGEIGHVEVPCQGKLVPLQNVVSRVSLGRMLEKSGIDSPTVEDLAQFYSDKNPVLLEWLDQAIEPLSAAISIVENLLDPQTIILGGAMPDNILDHLISHMRLSDHSVSMTPNRLYPRLLKGTSGRMTATHGGAALVINRVFTPNITPQPQEN